MITYAVHHVGNTADHTPKYGSRSLKGFSTQVQSKMVAAKKPEPEAVDAKNFHATASYGNAHIQAALKALTTGGTGSFSECTTPGTATEEEACTGTWTQGTALCKHKDTRALLVPTGVGFTAQKARCIATGDGNLNGIVTDFSPYYTTSDSSMSSASKLSVEVAQKMAVYTNAWLYTVHEFEDAIADCSINMIADNDAGVHAWDEGVVVRDHVDGA